MRLLRKTIVIMCIAVCFGSILFLIALDPYYYSTRPREPHPESGRIFRERVKGSNDVADVYLTRNERLPYDYAAWIQCTSMLFAGIAFFLNDRWKVIRNPHEDMPKKFIDVTHQRSNQAIQLTPGPRCLPLRACERHF